MYMLDLDAGKGGQVMKWIQLQLWISLCWSTFNTVYATIQLLKSTGSRVCALESSSCAGVLIQRNYTHAFNLAILRKYSVHRSVQILFCENRLCNSGDKFQFLQFANAIYLLWGKIFTSVSMGIRGPMDIIVLYVDRKHFHILY